MRTLRECTRQARHYQITKRGWMPRNSHGALRQTTQRAARSRSAASAASGMRWSISIDRCPCFFRFVPTRLGRGDRDRLEQLIRTHTTPQRVVKRARIVLASSDGTSGNVIAEELGVSGLPSAAGGVAGKYLTVRGHVAMLGAERDPFSGGRKSSCSCKVLQPLALRRFAAVTDGHEV